MDVDLDAMAGVYSHLPYTFAGKDVRVVRDKVRNLSEVFSRKLDPAIASPVLSRSIAEEPGIELIAEELNPDKQKLAEALCREKYRRREWTFRKEHRIGKVIAAKTKSGVVPLEICLEGSTMASIDLARRH